MDIKKNGEKLGGGIEESVESKTLDEWKEYIVGGLELKKKEKLNFLMQEKNRMIQELNDALTSVLSSSKFDSQEEEKFKESFGIKIEGVEEFFDKRNNEEQIIAHNDKTIKAVYTSIKRTLEAVDSSIGKTIEAAESSKNRFIKLHSTIPA